MLVFHIDDNCAMQKLLPKYLSKYNIAHIPIPNPRDALTYLSNPQNPRPNFIFLKLQIPVMGPAEFMHVLRTQPPFATDPVLRATPVIGVDPKYVFREAREKFIREWGLDDVMPRPLKSEVVRDVLRHWSRREVVLDQGAEQYGLRPVWGPVPLRRYSGPRSLL